MKGHIGNHVSQVVRGLYLYNELISIKLYFPSDYIYTRHLIKASRNNTSFKHLLKLVIYSTNDFWRVDAWS